MKKWEYKIKTNKNYGKDKDVDFSLDEMGEAGWELVTVATVQYNDLIVLAHYFKREKK